MTVLPALPRVDDAESYEELWPRDELFVPFVSALGRAHGVSQAPERYRSGTAVAYRLGELVLKLYPEVAAGDADIERHVLTTLSADSQVPSPRPVAQGRQGDWSYLLMTHLPGATIDQQWSGLACEQRLGLMQELGRIVRALHGHSGQGLPRLDDDFAAFRRFCRERADTYHVQRGFAAERAEEVSSLLRDLDAEPEVDDAQVLLHTELGPGHLLIEGGHITGLFDFGEARAGLPEYDFAAVGLFVTRGDRAAFSAFLDAYGVPVARRGRPLVRRLMRHALLHQYGHLSFYLQRSPVPDARDLYGAAEHWFGHDA